MGSAHCMGSWDCMGSAFHGYARTRAYRVEIRLTVIGYVKCQAPESFTHIQVISKPCSQ